MDESRKDEFQQIRRHFRSETSKLDNWIYHRRLDEYLQGKSEEVKADGKSEA